MYPSPVSPASGPHHPMGPAPHAQPTGGHYGPTAPPPTWQPDPTQTDPTQTWQPDPARSWPPVAYTPAAPPVSTQPVSAQPVPPPRRRVPTSVVVLCGLLVVALFALGTSIAVGVRRYDAVTAERDRLQTTVDAQTASEAARRKQFADADLPAKYRAVRDADQRLEVTFSAWIATTIGTDAERAARSAWRSARDACLRAVTTFQTAALPFPREWFTQSGTPSVVDLSQPDTDCWYDGS